MKYVVQLFTFFLFNSFVTLAQNSTEEIWVNDLLQVHQDGKIGLQNPQGKFVVPLGEYTQISYDVNLDLYKCFVEEGFRICTGEGELVQSEYVFTEILEWDLNEFLKVRSTKGVGYLKNYKVWISPIYDDVRMESETYMECCLNFILEMGKQKGLFIDGIMFLEPIYTNFEKLGDSEFLIVEREGKMGVVFPDVNHAGNSVEILPNSYQAIDRIAYMEMGTIYSVNQNGLEGTFLVTGNLYAMDEIVESAYLIIPPKYKKINWKARYELTGAQDPRYVVPHKEGFVLLNTFPPLKCLEIEEVFYSENMGEVIAVKTLDHKYQFISVMPGELLEPEKYDKMVEVSDVVAVKKGAKWGIPYVTEMQFDSIEELERAYENGDY